MNKYKYIYILFLVYISKFTYIYSYSNFNYISDMLLNDLNVFNRQNAALIMGGYNVAKSELVLQEALFDDSIDVLINVIISLGKVGTIKSEQIVIDKFEHLFKLLKAETKLSLIEQFKTSIQTNKGFTNNKINDKSILEKEEFKKKEELNENTNGLNNSNIENYKYTDILTQLNKVNINLVKNFNILKFYLLFKETIITLGNIGGAKSIDFLSKFLKYKSEDIRNYTVLSLYKIQQPIKKILLYTIHMVNDPNVKVRKNVLDIIKLHKTNNIKDLLIHIVNQDKSKEVVDKAKLILSSKFNIDMFNK